MQESGFNKFGIISDLRQWEGSTPEALGVAKMGLDYFYENGQIASAQVCESSLSKKLVEPIYHLQKQRMHAIVHNTMQEAILWMQDLVEEETHS